MWQWLLWLSNLGRTRPAIQVVLADAQVSRRLGAEARVSASVRGDLRLSRGKKDPAA